MDNTATVTQWLDQLQAGDSAAAQKIWERYFSQLVKVAHVKLGSVPRRVSDQEDVAVEAFACFFRSVASGRFPRLNDRDDLWQLLLLLAERRAVDAQRRHFAKKRGGGRVRGDSVLDQHRNIGECQKPMPSTVEELAAFMRSHWNFEDQRLKQITLDKLQGYTNKEIASRQQMSVRSVERHISIIRNLLSDKND